jgi:hypothetical protein
MARRELGGSRYAMAYNAWFAQMVANDLPSYTYDETIRFYRTVVAGKPVDENGKPTGELKVDHYGRAFLGCNDRYFLLTQLMRRNDALHPWIFKRCREVEASPDNHIDLWARGHYKSTLITFAGAIQEIIRDPEIKIAIFSAVGDIAREFLGQIKEELEGNEYLKSLYNDVFYLEPKSKGGADGRPAKWSIARGITVKRRSNPKEATIEAHGLLDGQPTSRHFDLHIYDDIVTQDYLSEEQIRKTTERYELADNLGTHLGVRKQIGGTRYHFADTYSTILERKGMTPRIYPATSDGTMNGKPVLLSEAEWTRKKSDQRSQVAAQMLLNPIAGSEAVFRTTWFRSYDVYPSIMNVYIMCDPSKGKKKSRTDERPDRTAIAVIGIDPGGNKYLLDGYRHRMRLSVRWDFIKRLRAKWSAHRGVQLVKVGYEQYGMQADLEVMEDYQRREGEFFDIEELAYPRQGPESKNGRIERLEPDMRTGRFYLPATVWHPDYGGAEHLCYWNVWRDEDREQFEAEEAIRVGAVALQLAGYSPDDIRQMSTAERARRVAKLDTSGIEPQVCPHNVGQILYRPTRGLTRAQRFHDIAGQRHRIVRVVKRVDEEGDMYDLTRCFMDEARQHPFAPHDDLIDAISRLYDLEPTRPEQFEGMQTTAPLGEDLLPEEVGASGHDMLDS